MISMDKQYQYRNGKPARILCNDRSHRYPVISMGEAGQLYMHDAQGRVCPDLHEESEWDLIEVPPFGKDEPVMVRLKNGSWFRRYYSHFKDGLHFCFDHGKTSWTTLADVDVSPWCNCRRPTAEELEGK